jgi:hypothetical protein
MADAAGVQNVEATSTPESSGSHERPVGLVRRVSRQVEKHPTLAVFCFAFGIRLLVAVVVAVHFHGVLFQDDAGYLQLAANAPTSASDSWDAGTWDFYYGVGALLVPISALFAVFGPYPILALTYVAVLGATAAALSYRVASLTLPTRAALVAGAVVAALPSQVLFSSVVLKDAIVWAVLAGFALVAAVANRARTVRILLLTATTLCVLAFVMAHLRMQTLVVAMWATAMAAWFGHASLRVRRGLGAVVLGVALPWALGAGPAGTDLLRQAGQGLTEVRAAGAQGAATALVAPAPAGGGPVATAPSPGADQTTGGPLPSSTGRPATPNSAGGTASPGALPTPVDDGGAAVTTASEDELSANVRYFPKGISVMLFGPFPWEPARNINLVLAHAETLLWYPLVLLAILGALVGWRRRDVLAFPVICGAGVLAMYGLAEGPFGTAFRHRGVSVWAMAVLAAVGLDWARNKRRSRTADKATLTAASPP